MRQTRFQFWMLHRYLKERRRYFSLNLVLSALGMSFGVAALIVAMAIVSGFETTLKTVSIDSFGDLIFARRGASMKLDDDLVKRVQSSSSEIKEWTPFLLTEAIFVSKGKVAGVIIEGIDQESHSRVLNLKKHLRDGEFNIQNQDDIPQALIGKNLKSKMKLEVGDVFRLVVPITEKAGSDRFRPKSIKLKLAGVLSLGRHDFDERYVVLDIKTLQKFTGLKDKISGLRLKIEDSDRAYNVAESLNKSFGFPYWTKTWRDANHNLFEAIKYEKPTLFLIVCLIVVAAAFNISTSLYVSVLKRFRDISIMKTLGADPKFIRRLFVNQGILISAMGSLFGVILGLVLCWFLVFIQNYVPLFPGEVYRIDFVKLETRVSDVLIILAVSIVIGYFSTWAPARRGARLKPVQGLRYE